jgi:WD40 repeat protein
MTTPDVHDMLLSYLRRELPADQAVALELRLKNERELADALVELAREEAILTEWARTVAVPACDEPVTEPARETVLPLTTVRRRVTMARWAALAASLAMIAAGSVWLTSRPTTSISSETVTVEQTRGEVLLETTEGGVTIEDGQQLRAGQAIRTGGEDSFAVLRYPDSTRLFLAADTMVRLLGPEGGARENHHVFVPEGELVADVAQPMVLGTRHGEVLAQGGRFTCSSAAAATRVETEHGQVRFIRASDRAPLDIQAGFYAIAADREEQFVLRRRPEPATSARLTIAEGSSGPLLALAYHPTGQTLVTGGSTGTIKLWDASTGDLRLSFPGHASLIRTVEFSRDGTLLLTTSNDKRPKVFDAVTGQEKLALRRHRTDAECAAFAPDSSYLATIFANGKDWGEVHFWHPSNGTELGVLRVGSPVLSLAFSDDGAMLAVGCRDGSVRVCRVTATAARVVAEEERLLSGHVNDVRSVACKGDLVASAGVDGTARVWRLSDGRELHVLTGHAREVRSVSFSVDGRYLATAGNDSTARVWRLSDGREMFTAKDRKNAVTRALISPDGRTLATTGGDRTVKLWTLEHEANVAAPLFDRW